MNPRIGSANACISSLMYSDKNRPACLARELSKIHEEFTRGTLEEILVKLGDSDPKGECIILVGGR